MYMRLCATLMLVIAMAASPFISHGAPIDIKISTSSPDAFPFIPAFREMARHIEEASGGKYRVSIYPNYKLGNASTAVQGLQMGTIHFHHDGTGNMSGFTPVLGVFDLPYIFSDMKSVEHVFYGPLGKQILEQISNKNLTYLGFANSTFRNMITRTPVTTLEDIRKMKIRVTLSKVHAESLKRMGISVTPMPGTEVYTGLQQGIIDGLDIDYPYAMSHRWYEVAPHVFESNHLYTPQVLITGTRWWNALAPEDRAIFKEGVDIWLSRSRTLLNEYRDEAKKVCVDAGNTVVTPSPDELRQWAKAAESTRTLLTPPQKALYDDIHAELVKAGLAQ